MGIFSTTNKLINTTYLKIIVGLIILYIVVQLLNSHTERREGFVQRERFVYKDKPEEIFDDFYASIYDDLVYDPTKNMHELIEISRVTNINLEKPSKSLNILDIGSGNGHHVNLLNRKGINVRGIEISDALINRSKKLYPDCKFIKGDALNNEIIENGSISHILCLYFTIYYIKDKDRFFENCYKWLKKGGYVAIHLVNRDKFNPMVSASEVITMVSPQKYAKKRIMDSNVKFKDFQYKSTFSLDPSKDIAKFEEKFINDGKEKNVRKHNHNLYIPKQKDIINIALNKGFELIGKIDLVTVKYEYQYIYILQKKKE